MKVLCVAEKNSIAKGVSSILGGGSVRTRSSGYQYVKNYDFQFDGFPFTQYPCSVTMTSVAGHLKGIDFRGEQYKWGKGDIYPLFDAPLMDTMNNDQRHIASNIRREAQRADFLVIWTDCDREGEYIGWEIFQEANIGNEELTENQMYRAVFSHVERNHILHAARNTIRLDMKSVDAVSTRIELDLRTGVTFTRLLTNTLKRRVQNARIEPGQSALSYMNQEFNTRKESFVISYGPCQFPTLGFVVDRFERIRNFIPEEFWYIQVQISDGMCSTDEEDLIFSDRDEDEEIFKLSTMTTTFQWQRNHLFDRHSVLAIYMKCV